ncbi:hypothetical protein B0H19DRAFT_1228612 [Mycena capillaripes]|nr:hypothetical protein B0H19DRAFT_1228612 [Mycena capillaripes]
MHIFFLGSAAAPYTVHGQDKKHLAAKSGVRLQGVNQKALHFSTVAANKEPQFGYPLQQSAVRAAFREAAPAEQTLPPVKTLPFVTGACHACKIKVFPHGFALLVQNRRQTIRILRMERHRQKVGRDHTGPNSRAAPEFEEPHMTPVEKIFLRPRPYLPSSLLRYQRLSVESEWRKAPGLKGVQWREVVGPTVEHVSDDNMEISLALVEACVKFAFQQLRGGTTGSGDGPQGRGRRPPSKLFSRQVVKRTR